MRIGHVRDAFHLARWMTSKVLQAIEKIYLGMPERLPGSSAFLAVLLTFQAERPDVLPLRLAEVPAAT
jgi:hypothetical protein